MKILIAEPKDFSDKALDYLGKKFEIDLAENLSQEEFEDAFFHYDIIWFRLKYNVLKLTEEQKLRCKYIVCPVTGVNHISDKFIKQHNIKLISLKGETTFLKEITPTAELAIFLAMSVMRNSVVSIEDVKNGNWDRDKFRGNELKDKKIGIIGFGRLGEMTAKLFSAFGCEIIVFDPNKNPLNCTTFEHKENIADVFKICDVISIHVDLNPTTTKLIDQNLLRLCKGSYLINTSRGEVLNEKEVINAIELKNLKGFAADVIENEAINYKESELFQYAINTDKNIILTPHIGGNTYESFEKTEMFVANKLIKQIKQDGRTL